MAITQDEVRAIAKAIAEINQHPIPDDYAEAVASRYVPPVEAPVEPPAPPAE